MLGLIGGAGMQSLTQATMTAKDQLSKYQVNNIENTINNKEIKDLFVLNIKDRILSGEITKKQGEAELNSLRESEGVLTQIPDNISSEDRYKSFKLINERNEIQKQVQGKDPALVTAQTERINEINEELKKIVVSYYGEMGKLIEEYYFWNNNLFFVFTQDYLYNMPKIMDGSKVEKIYENRYYFQDDKLIRWLDPNKEKVAKSKIAKKETEILQNANKLKEKAN